MKVLVIPDVHLKPWIFERATELMREGKAERAVSLMDLPDDWNQQLNIDLYIRTFDAAMRFQAEFPDTLWCYGNHDVSYLWRRSETGYSSFAEQTVVYNLYELRKSLPEYGQMAFIHRIDNVIFSHGGLCKLFVANHVPYKDRNDIDKVIERINGLGPNELWGDISPIWCRPQYNTHDMYKPRKYMQVVGHTPVKQIEKKNGILSCDVFSTDPRTGEPVGSQEFAIVDTVERKFVTVK